MQSYEKGLIKQYVDKIRSLAVQAQQGAEVEKKIEKLVQEACEHFRIVNTSNQANLDAFRGQLKMQAELVHSSQPMNKKALEYAISKCPDNL